MFDVISREEKYSGSIFKVYTDTVLMPDGSIIRRETVEKHQDAAAVLALRDNGNVVFVRQYRHSAGKEVLEIPAGIADEGESALECAIRELEEEAGIKAGKMEFMLKFYTAIGFCDEEVSVFLASRLTDGVQHLDEDENLVIEEYPLDEAIKMVFDGRIVDSKTILALLSYKEYLIEN